MVIFVGIWRIIVFFALDNQWFSAFIDFFCKCVTILVD